jgi:hypothetical protein
MNSFFPKPPTVEAATALLLKKPSSSPVQKLRGGEPVASQTRQAAGSIEGQVRRFEELSVEEFGAAFLLSELAHFRRPPFRASRRMIACCRTARIPYSSCGRIALPRCGTANE